MLNMQSPEKRSHSDSEILDVHSMFVTIQGEGPFVGEPAFFIRLAGCNLQCPGCDTDYTTDRERWNVRAMVCAVQERFKHKLVVITGGEPFRQNIAPFCGMLIARGYYVQIETNGSLGVSDLDFWRALAATEHFMVVCSPKAGSVHHTIESLLMITDGAYKYVLKDGDVNPEDGLPIHALDHAVHIQVARPVAGVRVYVQPMDEGWGSAENARHLQAALDSANKFGYRLCIQTHKIIGVP